jgi:hypothetical protein
MFQNIGPWFSRTLLLAKLLTSILTMNKINKTLKTFRFQLEMTIEGFKNLALFSVISRHF